jgi:Tol biopolymer transport system component
VSQNRILFTRFQGNNHVMFNDIYAINPDGNNETRLIDSLGEDGEYMDNASPRYNKDKTQIAFLSSKNNLSRLFNVFIMTLADRVLRQITTGTLDMTGVDWAPDDSRFVVSCKSGNGLYQIHLLSLDGVILTQLTSGPEENMNAQLSPHGNLIAFTQFPPTSKTSHIWIMDSDGGNQLKLTSDETAHSNPSWSPDGSWVIFRCDLGTPHLRRINVYTGEVFVYPAPASGFDSSPLWSGREIVFSSNRDWEKDEYIFNLYIMSENGNNIRRLTTNQTFEYCGDW